MNQIIDSKRIIINSKDGTQIVDLLQRSYSIGMNTVPFEKFGYVTSQMEMRSDIFSRVYGTSENDQWDILKYNGISNPFALKEGDILLIPSFNNLLNTKYTEERRSVENPKQVNSKQQIRDQVLQLINFSDRVNIESNTFEDFKKKYSNLKELKKQQVFNNLRNENNNNNNSGTGNNINDNVGLPPNFNTTGKNEFEIKENGEVTFGASGAKNANDCERKTFTKAELINSLLKNRRTLR